MDKIEPQGYKLDRTRWSEQQDKMVSTARQDGQNSKTRWSEQQDPTAELARQDTE